MENAPTTNSGGMSGSNSALAVMQSNMARQPVVKQLLFLVAIAASIALGGYVLMWSQSPSYQVLFSGMGEQETAEVLEVLQGMNVDYKLDENTGALMVPADEKQRLRLRLASEGLPRSSAQGMDMLNEDQGFGTSQFIERARYQRAMEQELARSISEVQSVRSARVHLAVPKESVFVRERKQPTASVIVNLYSGRSLQPGQVSAISHMVASSVPNMESEHVSVVDQRGNLLTQPERDGASAMSDSQLEYAQKLEERYVRRIEQILTPIVGRDGVRAQVAADIDFTVTEKTFENYDPDSSALRSEQIQEDERVGGGPSGVPGALTNQPPGGAVAPEQTVEEPPEDGEETTTETEQVTPGSTSKSATRNFELDRTITSSRMAPGNLQRLSIAVLVNERQVTDDEGNVTTTPLNEQEMQRIGALVREAVGFNEARGDSINVVNAEFMAPDEMQPIPEEPIWQQPWAWDIAKQVAGALVVLFLIFGILRPAMRDLLKPPARKQAAEETADEDAAQKALAGGEGGQDIAKLTTGSQKMEENLSNVRSLVQQDPQLVAQVVKNWTASDA